MESLRNDSKIRFFGRYVTIWSVSRGLDGLIVLITILCFDDRKLPIGWAIGLAVDCVIDFFGQKIWVNGDTRKHWPQLILKFLGYLAIRGSIGFVTAYVAWSYAGKAVNMKLALSYTALSIVPWFIQFVLNRWWFQGTIQNISIIAYKKLVDAWKGVRSE
jgi:putative flippase GtrA